MGQRTTPTIATEPTDLGTIELLVATGDGARARSIAAGLARARSARFEVRHASDLYGAMSATARGRVAAALLDLRPAGGFDLEDVAAMRARAARLAIVVLADGPREQLARRALDCGADEFVLSTGGLRSRELELVILAAVARRELAETRRRIEASDRRLRDADMQMRALFDHVPLAILQSDLEARYVGANWAAAQMIGLPPEEIVGRTPDELYDSAVAAATNADERTVRERGEPITFETTAAMRNADPHDYQITKYPIHDVDGTLTGVGSLALDITELRRAEATAAQMAEIVKSTHAAVVGLSLDGVILSWNPAAERLFGYSVEEIVGRNVELLVPAELRQEVVDKKARINTGASVGEFETVRRHRDGTDIHVSITLSPVIDAKGTAVGASAIVRDITAQRAMQERLSASEERFRATFDNAPVGIAMLCPDGRTLGVNRALSEMLGYDEDELLAMRWQSITHHDDVAVDADQIVRMLAGEVPAYAVEKRYLRSDGSILAAEVHVSLVRAASGEPMHIVAQVLDITQRKHDEGRLRAQAREQEALTEVATLVASEANPRAVFAAATQRVAELLEADFALVLRLEPGGAARVVGSWSAPHLPSPALGAPFDVDGESPIQTAVRAAMFAGDVRAAAPRTAVRRALAEPITVNGQRWGSVSVGWEHDRIPDQYAEARVASIGHLVSLAVTGSEAREQLSKLATTDHLTGLFNRRAFSDRLEEDVARARRHERPLSLAIFDLDNFKLINDRYGHPTGDQVLAAFAARLMSQRREGDIIARVGGEEFAWILPDTGLAGAQACAERVRRTTAATPFAGVGILTTSVGVSELSNASDARELFRRADLALYWAKSSGRNGVCRWTVDAVADMPAPPDAHIRPAA